MCILPETRHSGELLLVIISNTNNTMTQRLFWIKATWKYLLGLCSDSSVQEWVKVTWGNPHDSKTNNILLKDNLTKPYWNTALLSSSHGGVASLHLIGFVYLSVIYPALGLVFVWVSMMWTNVHAFLLTILLLYCMRPSRTPSQKWSIAAPYIIRGCNAPDSVAIS